MSENTQLDGRTPFTERDFAFTPSAFADDEHRTDLEWQTKLLWVIREGDPTFDVEARMPQPDLPAPIITLLSGPTQRVAYGGAYAWTVNGSVTNYDEKVTYAPVQLTIIDGGDVTADVDADGNFSYQAVSPYKDNLLVKPQLTAVVEATLGKKTAVSNEAAVAVDLDFYVSQPVLSGGSAAPDTVETGVADEKVTVTFSMFNNGPGKYQDAYLEITAPDGTKKNLSITEVPENYTIEVANSEFVQGENKIALYARSQYNGEMSNYSAKVINSVTGKTRPAAPTVTVQPNDDVTTDDATFTVNGTVGAVVGTTMTSASMKLGTETLPLTKASATSFTGTFPVSKLKMGANAFTVTASLTGDGLVGPDGTGNGSITLKQGMVAAPTVTTSDVTVALEAPATIASEVTAEAGTVTAKVTFNGTDFPITAPDFTVEVPTTGLTAGDHPFVVTATAELNGVKSNASTANGKVTITGE